ncbi:hypothetical protein [Streptomyces sp.]|uniref:hypothetical protein n=1 Tax=Streptomyces sp. TaxID=1931 RepID=UPI002F948408
MTAPEHAATAAELVERYREGAMSNDIALTAMTTLTGLDEADAAFLLIEQWTARHRADGAADDEDWWTR